jgi:hypothetical protein
MNRKGPKPKRFCKRGHDKTVTGMHGRNCAECTRAWLRARYRPTKAANLISRAERLKSKVRRIDFIPAERPDRDTFFRWQSILNESGLGMCRALDPWKVDYMPQRELEARFGNKL